MSLSHRALLFSCVLLLGSCGFHLRNAVELPPSMNRTVIKGTSASELYYEIENALRNAGGSVEQSLDNDTSVLTIHSQGISRRVLSVDDRGRDAAYELELKLVFSLNDPQGKVIASRESVSVTRDYSFDPSNVLAKNEEEASLRSEMLRQGVAMMLRRLQALTRQPTAAEAPTE